MRALLLAALWLLPLAACSPRAGGATDPAGVERDLRRVYQEMLDGIRARDTLALQRILTEQYRFTNPSMSSALSRADRFRLITSSAARLDTLQARRCDFQLYGSAAVGTCVVRETGLWNGESFSQDVLSTVTFVREREGPWRIASTHASSAAAPD